MRWIPKSGFVKRASEASPMRRRAPAVSVVGPVPALIPASLAVVLLLGLSSPAGADYTYRKIITIHASQVSGSSAHPDFPVLINISSDDDLRTTAYGGRVTSDLGHDIIFKESTGTTQLDHEKEEYEDDTGRYIAWVRIPSLAHDTETIIYLYYGDSEVVTSQENIPGVWDEHYVMVQHLKETTGSHLDSTSNDNDSTVEAVTQQGADIGRIGRADEFDGDHNRVEIPDSATLDITGELTLSAWINIDTFVDKTKFGVVAKYRGYIQGTGPVSQRAYDLLVCGDGLVEDPIPEIQRRKPGYIISSDGQYGSGHAKEIVTEGELPLGTGTWYHLAAVFDPSSPPEHMKVYIDGDEVLDNTDEDVPASIYNSPAPLWIGVQATVADWVTDTHLDGIIDEVRVSAIARNPDWIRTCVNNQGTPSDFYTVGGEEPTVVELISFNACPRGEAVILSWETASEVETAGFRLWRSEGRGGEYTGITESLIPAEGGPPCGAHDTYTDSGVIPGRFYTYRLEDVSYDGSSTFHGPVSVVVPREDPANLTIRPPGKKVLCPVSGSPPSRRRPPRDQ